MSFTLFNPSFRFHELFTTQCATLVEAASLLRGIFVSHPDVAAGCRRIQELDMSHRSVSREIARELSLTQIRPLDREDVHELNMALAGSFGAIKGISTRIGLYEFRQIPGAARELAANLSEMSERLQSMVEILNRGLRVEEQSREIEAIRAESDHFLVVGLGELYESQAAGVAELLETIKWSQLYDRLEDATERTQQVANVLESIVQKNL